ncbi:MAG: threonine ammonia-lyase [Pseudomonadota bacterium]
MESRPVAVRRREFLRLAALGLGVGAALPLARAFAGLARADEVGLDQIREAARGIAGHVFRTPCLQAGRLSTKTKTKLFLKLENLQYTGAFKERGALNKMLSLTAAARENGVIAASAGNHSQGVAYHAGRLGIRSFIIMPHGTPSNKIEKTKALGAEVTIEGDSFDQALAFALDKGHREGLTFIHPFDDPLVIAGQGTVGLEMLEDVPDLDVLLIPIGGGGLISGCAAAAKALKPGIKVFGVESKRYAAMRQRLRGQPVEVGGDTIAEGLAVHNVGELPFAMTRFLVDDVLLVEEETIEKAIALLFDQEKIVAEGAGAAGVAALLEHGALFEGRRIGIPITGGNIDQRVYSNLLLRGLARDGRLVRISAAPPGGGDSFPKIADLISKAEGVVIEVSHDYSLKAPSLKTPAYNLLVQTRDRAHADRLVEILIEEGFSAAITD